jgi:hypothetical protein
MANGDGQRVADLISVPLEQLLVALGSGIGRSQAELDRHTIQTQALIDEHPVLSQYGVEATWYQIPTTELELKISVAMEQPRPTAQARAPALAAAAGGPLELGIAERFQALPRLWAQPVNARYTNQFGFDLQAASTVKLSIVAVPPPAPPGGGTPTSTEAEVLATARPYLLPKDDLTKSPKGRVTVNFNAAARAWYVVQSEETDGTVVLDVLVKLEDGTLAVLKHEEGA